MYVLDSYYLLMEIFSVQVYTSSPGLDKHQVRRMSHVVSLFVHPPTHVN